MQIHAKKLLLSSVLNHLNIALRVNKMLKSAVKEMMKLAEPNYEEPFWGFTTPNLHVEFYEKKPPQDGKEWYRGFIEYNLTEAFTIAATMSMATELLASLTCWSLHQNKPRMKLTIADVEGRNPMSFNLKLHSTSLEQAMYEREKNEALMELIIDALNTQNALLEMTTRLTMNMELCE